jgi:hypothetical protein
MMSRGSMEHPTFLTVGCDGARSRFTERDAAGNRIGRTTDDSQIIKFPLPLGSVFVTDAVDAWWRAAKQFKVR